ncbi:MAG TPA: class I SAM-dependent methyltransferase [Anaerolineales bacterium]|nr:class I SAM-dependent methyltransferase [Anaerolineales bacterium]
MNHSIAPAIITPAATEFLDLQDPLLVAIRDYWNEHIHDLEIATQPIGSAGFFQELDEYRFDKLRYLPRLVDCSGYGEKKILEVGCGVGIDLVRFARGGAVVTGIDLAEVSIALARQNFASNGLIADLQVMNGEALGFPKDSFDMVYAHGVLQYTANPERMVKEIHRVLRPGGTAIMMVYNRRSWLNALSKVMNVGLEHEDAPVLRKYSIGEFKQLLKSFSSFRIIPERFPVATRLHHGLKAVLYNQVFVRAFQALPKGLVRPLGWHLMAFAAK